jgi:hypothetical protein
MSCDLISNLGMSQSVRLVRVMRRVRKRAVMEEGAEERRFGSFVACRWEKGWALDGIFQIFHVRSVHGG